MSETDRTFTDTTSYWQQLARQLQRQRDEARAERDELRRVIAMKKLTCVICGYRHETAVYVCADGVPRCKVCRRKLQYGKYVNDQEAAERRAAGDYNPRYDPDPDADLKARGLR